MKPFKDQEISIQQINNSLLVKDRLLFQLATGGGKTACFSFIAKIFYLHTGKKVLILAHRDELINQTVTTLRKIGVSAESVTAQKKILNHLSNAYVAMVQTLKNRLKKDTDFLKDVGLIIIDECHLLMHEEIFNYYSNAKILGVTATPVLLKKVSFTKCHKCHKISDTIDDCCGYEMYEYTRNYTLSEIYHNIILGTNISDLINENRLVPEIIYSVGNIDKSKFKIGFDGDYIDTDQTFAEKSKIFDVVKNYNEIALNKKTIIFNSSTNVNLKVYEEFIDKGFENVKMFDSINSLQSERLDTLKWFKETPNAILLNCGCFTTGFDEPTIECVILNLSTKSLSKFLQMVGRGGRTTSLIYKPNFILIDLGGNVKEHGKWSDDKDWQAIFYGTNEKPKAKKELLDDVCYCPECNSIIAKSSIVCPLCGYVIVQLNYKENKSNEVAQLLELIPKPCGFKIVKYCQENNADKNMAWKILINQILDLFKHYKVTEKLYQKTLNNGKFENSLKKLIMQPYRVIQISELESGTMRTKNYLLNKTKLKLEKYYEKNN